MQTKPFPEIDPSELKAVREFLLTSAPGHGPKPRGARTAHSVGSVVVRNGITRARQRSRTPQEP